MRVNSLPKADTWKRTGRDSNPRPFGSRANALPLRHTGHQCVGSCYKSVSINYSGMMGNWKPPPCDVYRSYGATANRLGPVRVPYGVGYAVCNLSASYTQATAGYPTGGSRGMAYGSHWGAVSYGTPVGTMWTWMGLAICHLPLTHIG